MIAERGCRMGFYDIMDEIAARQAVKSDTGDNKILGVMPGIVAKNYDAQMPGRVCVQIPVRDEDANELKWARLVMPSSGKKWGHYFLPEVGDQVLLAFEQGNIEKPYVIGAIPRDNNPFLTGAADENNRFKKIVTANGSTIQFEDAKQGEGKQDRISIYTPDKAHQIILDNEKNEILIGDCEEKNKLSIQSQQGAITIDAENKLAISVGEGIQVTMNGSSGTVSVKCGKLKVEASDGVKVRTDGRMGVSGSNVTLEASSVLKISSGGMASVSGSPVKLG